MHGSMNIKHAIALVANLAVTLAKPYYIKIQLKNPRFIPPCMSLITQKITPVS
jgi:hypothetical protein